MKEKQKPFRVFVRRESGYEPVLTMRFEVTDGHGVLVIQKKGRRSEPNPALVQEERDITPKALRAGRFIHVLAGTGRRQSYALSRMTDDLLARVPEERWTEVEPLTEYGFRYLILDEASLEPETEASPAAVAVPANAQSGASAAPTASRVMPVASAGKPVGGDGSSALKRAMAAIRSGRPGQDAEQVLRGTPRPAPTAKVSSGAPDAPPSLSGDASADVRMLQARLAELERKLADSITREKDLLEILGRWQEREIRS